MYWIKYHEYGIAQLRCQSESVCEGSQQLENKLCYDISVFMFMLQNVIAT